MIDLVASHKKEFKRWGEYDLFRTEREVVSAQAFMAAYSWVREGLLDDGEVVISPLIGSIDVIESLRFIANFKEQLNLSNHKLPQKYMYMLSKIAPIGRSSRSMQERTGVILLYQNQSSDIESLPKNTAVVFVDETVSTGASLRELKAFVSKHNKVEDKRTLAASLGIRWAVNDTAPAQELGDLRFSMASYGAALKVRISPDDLDEEPNGIFITDVSSCEDEAIHNQTDVILKRLNHDGGVFVLSLGGPRTPFLDHTKLDSIINSFRYKPQIVFSNADEFRYFTREKNIESSLFDCFPNARLVIVTLGQQGSIIRFEDRLIRIPPVSVDNPIDELGAGDTYMGTLLALMLQTKYGSWTEHIVEEAAKIASYASSLVIQSRQSRLTPAMAQQVLEFKNLL